MNKHNTTTKTIDTQSFYNRAKQQKRRNLCWKIERSSGSCKGNTRNNKLFFEKCIQANAPPLPVSTKIHARHVGMHFPKVDFWKVWRLLPTYLRTSSSEFFGVFCIVISTQNLTKPQTFLEELIFCALLPKSGFSSKKTLMFHPKLYFLHRKFAITHRHMLVLSFGCSLQCKKRRKILNLKF